jgi:hypothetical protein
MKPLLGLQGEGCPKFAGHQAVRSLPGGEPQGSGHPDHVQGGSEVSFTRYTSVTVKSWRCFILTWTVFFRLRAGKM